jgi:hypothetical protein
MGHFIINLPDNLQGDVRWGTVRKKVGFNLNPFRKNKQINETKIGYIVRVSNQEYRLFKSMDGKWSQDEDGEKELGSGIYLAIREAILEKETNSN